MFITDFAVVGHFFAQEVIAWAEVDIEPRFERTSFARTQVDYTADRIAVVRGQQRFLHFERGQHIRRNEIQRGGAITAFARTDHLLAVHVDVREVARRTAQGDVLAVRCHTAHTFQRVGDIQVGEHADLVGRDDLHLIVGHLLLIERALLAVDDGRDGHLFDALIEVAHHDIVDFRLACREVERFGHVFVTDVVDGDLPFPRGNVLQQIGAVDVGRRADGGAFDEDSCAGQDVAFGVSDGTAKVSAALGEQIR